MQASNFNLNHYLARVGFQGEVKADIASLTELMRCQLFSIPFENLDVQAGKVVSLVPEEIVDKLINRHRGGYCFELNGLFAMALQALGVEYRFVAARPLLYPEKKPKTHMAIVLKLEDELWLFDLGFGSYGIRAPMRLSRVDTEIIQDHDRFMLTREGECDYVVQASVQGTWRPQFSFDLTPYDWVDFIPANYYSSTHPDTIFVKKLIVILHTPSGRKILSGHTLKIIEQGSEQVLPLSEAEKDRVLREHFGLEIQA